MQNAPRAPAGGRLCPEEREQACGLFVGKRRAVLGDLDRLRPLNRPAALHAVPAFQATPARVGNLPGMRLHAPARARPAALTPRPAPRRNVRSRGAAIRTSAKCGSAPSPACGRRPARCPLPPWAETGPDAGNGPKRTPPPAYAPAAEHWVADKRNHQQVRRVLHEHPGRSMVGVVVVGPMTQQQVRPRLTDQADQPSTHRQGRLEFSIMGIQHLGDDARRLRRRACLLLPSFSQGRATHGVMPRIAVRQGEKPHLMSLVAIEQGKPPGAQLGVVGVGADYQNPQFLRDQDTGPRSKSQRK